ncbi:hypothetical protein C9374_002734 [Naegleria lovaniensis]|uniref:F-box domain-containing protein n=1 Tax=Naegleria lovaniensis TaxID=51637 RepID=A0AA88KL18_NAELO|nr:uncharacterized protein C9374_002734 [Naegleria lovaniensis]KAG2386288.1 hypothetical protein C9374_002734 [Naegleria lovaniensis]
MLHIKTLPEEVLEFHICAFLDLGSVMALSMANKFLHELISKSEVIWSRLTVLSSSCHPDDDQAEKLLKYLVQQLQLTDLKHCPLLNDQELLNYYKNKPNQFIFHWFRLFSFSIEGFQKYEPSLDEVQISKILFTNRNHSMRVMHTRLCGDWETCVANKKLERGITYYWCVHLTTYDEENANNAWAVLVGVDNLPNQPRDQDSSSMHYWLGRHPSKGFGYCVASDSFNNSYNAAKLNKQGDVIGVEYFHHPILNEVRMKIYVKNGCEERNHSFSYRDTRDGDDDNETELTRSQKNEITFRPAVSVVSRMSVSIFPWDGNVETLKKFVSQ